MLVPPVFVLANGKTAGIRRKIRRVKLLSLFDFRREKREADTVKSEPYPDGPKGVYLVSGRAFYSEE